MKNLLQIIILICFQKLAIGQSFQISENKRFITKNGQAFFWLGDTAWELFHKLDRNEAEYYLKKRAEQGFTVIQAVVLAELNGLQSPNAYGNLPLINLDPSQPNLLYFEHVDFIIKKANELGLNIALLPTWGDKVFKDKWGEGPEIFNEQNAKVFGNFIGTRYKTYNNIIWLLGGDRNPRENSNDTKIWSSMAKGIEEGTGGSNNALIGFHPQPTFLGSATWFHNEPWLDFNMFQTGHCRETAVFKQMKTVYDMPNIKPIIDGEPIYEDHPVCFNATEYGTSNSYDVRMAAYLNVFSGAFGHTYGCHDIWQFYSTKKEGVNGPKLYWQQALDLLGAKQMKHLKNLIVSKSFFDRRPDQSFLIEPDLSTSERIQACRGDNYALIYTTNGKPINVKLGFLPGSKLKATWYNPKTGIEKTSSEIENNGIKIFTPNEFGYGNDAVLILESN